MKMYVKCLVGSLLFLTVSSLVVFFPVNLVPALLLVETVIFFVGSKISANILAFCMLFLASGYVFAGCVVRTERLDEYELADTIQGFGVPKFITTYNFLMGLFVGSMALIGLHVIANSNLTASQLLPLCLSFFILCLSVLFMRTNLDKVNKMKRYMEEDY